MWSNALYNASYPKKAKRIDNWYSKNLGITENDLIEIEEDEEEKMESKQKLEVGDKYLSIIVDIGGTKFKFAAFKNKTKKGSEPDYKGNNLAVWINTKKAGSKPGYEEDHI
jgi:hypothetical protein